MGVSAANGLLMGSLIFIGATILIAAFLSIYVKQRTKDYTMKGGNAK
jgi:hypothetical protein